MDLSCKVSSWVIWVDPSSPERALPFPTSILRNLTGFLRFEKLFFWLCFKKHSIRIFQGNLSWYLPSASGKTKKREMDDVPKRKLIRKQRGGNSSSGILRLDANFTQWE